MDLYLDLPNLFRGGLSVAGLVNKVEAIPWQEFLAWAEKLTGNKQRVAVAGAFIPNIAGKSKQGAAEALRTAFQRSGWQRAPVIIAHHFDIDYQLLHLMEQRSARLLRKHREIKLHLVLVSGDRDYFSQLHEWHKEFGERLHVHIIARDDRVNNIYWGRSWIEVHSIKSVFSEPILA